MRGRGWPVCCAAVVLSACAGLPPRPPPPPLPQEAPIAGLPDGTPGSWPAADWWKRYADPTLDRLIEMSIGTAPTLATAKSRFIAARESVRLAGATSGAHIDLNGDADRQRLSDNGFIPPRLLGFYWYDQLDLGLSASYTFDWWGKQRDTVQAAVDQALAAQAERSASRVALASAIADAYFGWQADMNRLALAEERLAVATREAAIAADRVRQELDAGDSLQHNAESIAAIRDLSATLRGSAKLRVVAIAALLGRPESELPALVAKPLPVVAVGLPDDVKIDLIARRADIAASRWRVQSAQKTLESSRAAFFPDVSVNGLVGLQSVRIGKLLEIGSADPQVGAAIHLPLFDSGRLKARYRGTEAALDAAVAAYRQTLIDAASEVATEAATRSEIASQREQRQAGLDAAARLRSSAAARARQGLTDARGELDATEAWILQRDAVLQLDAAALSADIGLQRALGGGYDNAQDVKP